MDSNVDTTTTLRDYLRVLFRHKAVIAVTFITVMVTVFIGLKLKTPVYEAQVKMLISAQKQVEAPYYRELGGYGKVEIALTQSVIVKSNPVIERSVKALRLYGRPLDYEKAFCSPLKKYFVNRGVKALEAKLKPFPEKQKQALLFRKAVEELKESIEVAPIRDTNLFTISVSDFSPVGSAITANVVSRSYIIFDLEQQLAELQIKYGEKHLAVKQLKDNIEKMTANLNGEPIPAIEAIGPASVKIIEQAQVPIKPTGTPKLLTLILAFFMSGFLGVMLAFGFEYMDHTFKSPQDVETFLNLPLLGSIPKKKFKEKRLVQDAKVITPYTSSFQTISDQIQLLIKEKNLKTILMTSALEQAGTTTIIANLGICLAHKAGRKVLIIDANLRNPAIYKAFKIADRPGLADVLEDKISFDQAISRAKSQEHDLYVLTAGSTGLNPITLLDSSKMVDVIKKAREKYEIILIDCTNLRNFRDASAISSLSDGIVLIVNEGKTRRQVVKSALLPLQQKKANLIGVVLNNRTFPIPKGIYNRV